MMTQTENDYTFNPKYKLWMDLSLWMFHVSCVIAQVDRECACVCERERGRMIRVCVYGARLQILCATIKSIDHLDKKNSFKIQEQR